MLNEIGQPLINETSKGAGHKVNQIQVENCDGTGHNWAQPVRALVTLDSCVQTSKLQTLLTLGVIIKRPLAPPFVYMYLSSKLPSFQSRLSLTLTRVAVLEIPWPWTSYNLALLWVDTNLILNKKKWPSVNTDSLYKWKWKWKRMFATTKLPLLVGNPSPICIVEKYFSLFVFRVEFFS
jgi:hypothetical protein